jgi:hypothetical protein
MRPANLLVRFASLGIQARGLPELRAVLILIEPKHECCDHVDLHLVEVDTAMSGHSLAGDRSYAHDRKHFLCTHGYLHTFTFFLSAEREFLA